MDEPRKGRQTPTQSVILPYTDTKGQEAMDTYNSTGRTAQQYNTRNVKVVVAPVQ